MRAPEDDHLRAVRRAHATRFLLAINPAAPATGRPVRRQQIRGSPAIQTRLHPTGELGNGMGASIMRWRVGGHQHFCVLPREL